MSDIEKGHNHVAKAPPPTRIANPATLGLFSFASTTLMLSMYNLQARDIAHPNVVVGMAVFCGGLAQLLAGMWEFPRGNTFGGTAFSSYGAFWMSYATIIIPGSGAIEAYGGDVDMFENAVGFFLLAWFFVTFFLFVASFRKNVGLSVLFAFLDVTFLLLMVGAFHRAINWTKAGGGFGVATAFIAYYIGLADLLDSDARPVVHLPLGPYKTD